MKESDDKDWKEGAMWLWKGDIEKEETIYYMLRTLIVCVLCICMCACISCVYFSIVCVYSWVFTFDFVFMIAWYATIQAGSDNYNTYNTTLHPHTPVHTPTYIHTHIYIHTHLYTHIYMHTHIYMDMIHGEIPDQGSKNVLGGNIKNVVKRVESVKYIIIIIITINI